MEWLSYQVLESKKSPWIIGCTIAVVIGVMFSGCGTTSPQSIVLTTIGGVETSAYFAYKGYLTLVVTGNLPTNDVPKVNAAFNTFQKSAILATVAANNSTNGLAPTSLLEDSDALITLISTIEGKK